MKKYKFGIGVGYVGCDRVAEITSEELGFTDEEWDEMTEKEKQDILDEELENFVSNNVEQWWSEI